MEIDCNLPRQLDGIGASASDAEAAGFDGIWVGETSHDPFLMLLQAAAHTNRVTLGSSVAIAFARSPMTLANTGWDMAGYSHGRFVLGLGSQVKPHIEKRFSMPWSRPAPRMREFILALRAIWATWEEGTKLDFAGEFCTHTLMTPFFTPERHGWGPPPVFLAGVGPQMTEVAGEVADGFFFHAFTTASYLRAVTIPSLLRGRSRAGQAKLDGFTLAGPAFTCTGRTDAELETAIRLTKEQIAFYASTPAYRPVLEHHGWADLQPELTRLSKQGRWKEMGQAIDDEILDAFAVVGSPQDVGRGLADRWSSVADRITLYAPYAGDQSLLADVARDARRTGEPEGSDRAPI